MGLFKKKKTDLQELQLSEKHVGLRIVGFIILLAIGLGCIGYFLISLLNEDPGWKTINPTESSLGIQNEFIFNYNVGQGEVSATEEYKLISSAYTHTATKAYRLFDIYSGYDGVVNMYYINRNAGKTLEVDPVLYNAFKFLKESDSRILYMAPINTSYRNIFFCQNEIEAKSYDPYFDLETDAYFKEVLKYANDPKMIDLELLEDNKICLKVSEEYKEFALENGITELIDFSWLTNAFIVDYIADSMISRGYTKGNISSFDGYTRNLDASGERYGLNIFDMNDNVVYPAAAASYAGAYSIVLLKNYPMSSQDEFYYFCYSDHAFVNRYINSQTGRYESSLNNIISYSSDKSCAEVALKLSEVFISDKFEKDKVMALRSDNIFSIWTVDRVINYNDKNIVIGDLYSDEDLSYASNLIE